MKTDPVRHYNFIAIHYLMLYRQIGQYLLVITLDIEWNKESIEFMPM